MNKEKFYQGDFEWKIGNGVAFESANVTQLKEKKEAKTLKSIIRTQNVKNNLAALCTVVFKIRFF